MHNKNAMPLDLLFKTVKTILSTTTRWSSYQSS